VHEHWSVSSEIFFIDSTGNFDRQQFQVFALLIYGCAGALSFGIVVIGMENAAALCAGL